MYDGMPLPSAWVGLGVLSKKDVIAYLNTPNHSGGPNFKVSEYGGRDSWLKGFRLWTKELGLSSLDRQRIIRHLQTVGSIRPREVPRTTVSPSIPAEMLYPKRTDATAGKRILPSTYGRLTTVWLRGSGLTQSISTMNDGHLDNTVKLLLESHTNLVDRSCELLGKMHRHFQNSPQIQELLEQLCSLIQKEDVDDVYPIFKALTAEIASRKPEVVVNFEDQRDLDDDLYSW
jgi:hypothetical protein